MAPELSRAPVEHMLPLAVLDQLCRGIRWSDAPLLLAAHESGAAALRTPPHALMLTAMQELEELVALIAPSGVDGVNARESVARAFADACGRSATVRMRLHLLELGTLVAPRPPDRGAVRAATPADEEILWDFTCAMAAGLGEPEPPRDGLADRIAAGQAWLWEIGGEPVAYAGHSAPVAGVTRVAPVYTLPAASPSWVRRGGHGGGDRERAASRRARLPVHRREQPDVQRHLRAARLPPPPRRPRRAHA